MKRTVIGFGAAVGVAALFHVTLLALGLGTPAARVLSDVVWLLVSLVAGLAALDTRRRVQAPEERRAWGWFATGALTWCAGMVVWDYYEFFGNRLTPFPSLADAFFMLASPALAVGLYHYRGSGQRRVATLRRVADLLTAICVVGMIFGTLLYRPTQVTEEGLLYVVVALAYPSVHAVSLVFGVLGFWQAGRDDGSRRVLFFVLLSILFNLAGLTIYARSLLFGVYVSGSLVDSLWVLTFTTLCHAAWEERIRVAGRAPVAAPLVGLSAVVVAVTVSSVGMTLLSTPSELTPLTLRIVGVGLVALGAALGLRQLATSAEERLLVRRLQELNDTLEQRVEERTRELELTRDLAVRASEAKTRFLANMSHELRTPLSGILGYAELVSEELGDGDAEQVAADVANIRSAGEQLLGLINQLLDLSRVEAGHEVIAREDVDVAELILEVRTAVLPMVSARGNRLDVVLDEAPERVHLDRQRVRQILVNLVSNAAKFTESGTITVSASVQGPDLAFSVNDTGVGISADALERIFEPFEQAGHSAATRVAGTGLGLAISRSIAELLGGALAVSSAPGEGSTFTFLLPFEAGEART